jgi:hypothetical protein
MPYEVIYDGCTVIYDGSTVVYDGSTRYFDVRDCSTYIHTCRTQTCRISAKAALDILMSK